MYSVSDLFNIAKQLLIQLVETPSLSRQEHDTARILRSFFESHAIPVEQINNNIIVRSSQFDDSKPTILLNSHHDTVKPTEGWISDPFTCIETQGKLIGLGVNDAGASLVSLAAVFIYFYHQSSLPYNLVFVASAEEEVSGTQGMELVAKQLHNISLAIVGEPTSMNMAIAEKGLLVIDCIAQGVAGHAAHSSGENAIYKAISDIAWFQNYEFKHQSEFLGKVKMTVTCIQAGSQHNVIPAECSFTVDIRTNELYTNEEVFEIITQHVQSKVTARSFRLNSSHIDSAHPIVLRAQNLGITRYGSPTMSDQVFLASIPSVKIGPGDTLRSHTANEFIYESELAQGIQTYIDLLSNLQL